MLKHIKEFRKYIAIAGFKNVKLHDTNEFLKKINEDKPTNVEAQAFNAELVASWQHLYFAILNALTAFRNKENISKSLAMETLLYASAQHQISRATEILGIKPNLTKIAVLIIGDKPEIVTATLSRISKRVNAKSDETVLELTERKMANIQKTFEISDEELRTVVKGQERKKALIDLVIERMALLATER